MAQKNKTTSFPSKSSYNLDPMAEPYNLAPMAEPWFYFVLPPISSYNVVNFPTFYLQEPKPLPLPSPLKPKPKPNPNPSSSLTPVPWGPRIPASLRRRGGGKKQCRRQRSNWVPKNTTPTENGRSDLGFEEIINKKRWKNRNCGYHQILPMETTTSSLMIKNIPNKYTRKLLIQTLDNHCRDTNQIADNDFMSAYDFVYLPIDFNRRVNAGFAFVNFTDSKAASKFRDAFHGKRWDLFDSPKVAEISRARIQGKNGLINHCKLMDFSSGSNEDMPVWFEPPRDGTGRITSKMYTVGKFFSQPKI